MDERVRVVINEMNAGLDQPLSVRGLALSVNLSTPHLRRLFKTETGRSIITYLNDLRLQRARQLLETTFLSVKEIAAHVGQSPSHLITNFKKAHGVTPAQFAARYRRVPRGGSKRDRIG